VASFTVPIGFQRGHRYCAYFKKHLTNIVNLANRKRWRKYSPETG
jgi:hypothetical protein